MVLNNFVVWGSWILLGFIVYWFLIRPLFKKTEGTLKMGMRDFNIKQIKRSIKDMDITKEELFDE